LNQSSRLTGGQFFQANDTAALENVYKLIDQLEKMALLQQRFVAWRELFPWPAALALAILLAEFGWKQWRRFP
jgi:Ca-activated chloride channel family protein